MSLAGSLRVALAVVVWTALSAFALADDWVVERLRGEALVRIDGTWSPLRRGDVVSDSSPVRSLEGSRVTFTRGAEAIELSGATEIRIFDQLGERMTTIMQAYGTVTIEAERLQIQHFSVQTPFLAAIVKGTRFTVHSDDVQSSVDVSRGLVQVQDYVHGVATDITPGQSAVVGDDIPLEVVGRGQHAAVVTLDGHIIAAAGGATLDGDAPGRGHGAENGGNGVGNAYGHGNSENVHGNSGHDGNGNNGHNGNGNGNSGHNGNGNGGHNGNGNDGGNAGSNGNGNAYGHAGGNGNAGNDNPGKSGN